MIFYYSGTGNTRLVASVFRGLLSEKNISFIPEILRQIKSGVRISDLLDGTGDDKIGILFPIYSWGIPPVVSEFIEIVFPLLPKGKYVWAVCTPGDEAGIAMRLFRKTVMRYYGKTPDILASVIMPNDYVMLPGFTIDSKKVEQEKLRNMPARAREIARKIIEGQNGVYDVREGSIPALRTRLVFPLFRRWGVNPEKWKVDTSKCIHCGKCKSVCPSKNIELLNGMPLWGKNCFSCCGCYHICPAKAINYGSFTKGKGQYFCTADSLKDISEL